MLVAVTSEVLLWISAFWGEEDPSFKKSMYVYTMYMYIVYTRMYIQYMSWGEK